MYLSILRKNTVHKINSSVYRGHTRNTADFASDRQGIKPLGRSAILQPEYAYQLQLVDDRRHSSKLSRKFMESESLQGVNNKSHHNPSGGFTNPWPSFRNVGLLDFFSYARKHWDREASKVPRHNELYVKVLEEKKMAWETIRNPPKDRIQATWYSP